MEFHYDSPGQPRQRVKLTEAAKAGRSTSEVISIMHDFVHDVSRGNGTLLINKRPVRVQDILKYTVKKFI
jgi:hypothetical protein